MLAMNKIKNTVEAILLLLPLIVSVGMLVYLKLSWQVITPAGEKLAPISNKPLFIGLIILVMTTEAYGVKMIKSFLITGSTDGIGLLTSKKISNMINDGSKI